MSGFGFSEEQEMFRRTARDFAQRELAPGGKERVKQDRYPRELLKRIADMGFLGIVTPSEYGGQGADWVTLGIAIEELSKVDYGAGLAVSVPAILSRALLARGSEEMRRKWFPPVAKGEWISCLAVTEPHCGSDAAAIKTTAVRDEDGYLLSGEKTSITFGMIADFAMMPVKTDPMAKARGVSFFLVPLDLPGITRSLIPDMGYKPVTAASIFLDNVRLPAENRIGGEGEGFYVVMGQFDVLRVCLALTVLGVAEASLEDAISYAKQRTAFGQPIARFEGVSFKIAEHATWLEAARLLCYRALWLADQGSPHTKEAAMSKWLAPVVAVNAIHDSLLIHGHVGYSEEYPIEQRLRDAIGFEMADGTAQIMKMIIARELMGREFRPY